MPRKKLVKPPPFTPKIVHDDEGNEYLIDEPLIPPPGHHKTEKAKRGKMAIVRDILKHPNDWNLESGYEFAKSAIKQGFRRANIIQDDSALRRGYKQVLGMLSCFKQL